MAWLKASRLKVSKVADIIDVHASCNVMYWKVILCHCLEGDAKGSVCKCGCTDKHECIEHSGAKAGRKSRLKTEWAQQTYNGAMTQTGVVGQSPLNKESRVSVKHERF